MSPGNIRTVLVYGTVNLLAAGATSPIPLNRGAIFTEGATITTDSGGLAFLVLSNGIKLFLGPDSELTITLFKQAPFTAAATGDYLRLNQDPSKSSAVFSLKRGGLTGQALLSTATGSTATLETIAGIINLRSGGVFRITVLPTTGKPDLIETIYGLTSFLSFTPGIIAPGVVTQESIGISERLVATATPLASGALGSLSYSFQPPNSSADQALIAEFYNMLNTVRAADGLPPISPPIIYVSSSPSSSASYPFIVPFSTLSSPPPPPTPPSPPTSPARVP